MVEEGLVEPPSLKISNAVDDITLVSCIKLFQALYDKKEALDSDFLDINFKEKIITH